MTDDLRPIGIADGVVTRPKSPWTGTVHDYLRYLRSRGETGVPVPIDHDDTQERLRYIDGRSGGAGWFHQHDLVGLVSGARLLRRLHDSGRGWQPPDGATFALASPAPREGEELVWCHGDPGPWNFVWDDRHAVALLDWDLLHVAPRRDDVAYALWWFAPARDDELTLTWHHFPEVPERHTRLRAFVSAYDGDDDVLDPDIDWVEEMARRAERTMAAKRAFAEQGLEPQRTWVAEGSLERQHAEVAWLRANAHVFDPHGHSSSEATGG